jgi:hypothetical protein
MSEEAIEQVAQPEHRAGLVTSSYPLYRRICVTTQAWDQLRMSRTSLVLM